MAKIPKIKAKQIDVIDLGKYYLEPYIYNAIIPADNWNLDSVSGLYKQKIIVNGIESTDTPFIEPVRSENAVNDNLIMNSWYNISRITTDIDSITVYSSTNKLPSDIPITLQCYR